MIFSAFFVLIYIAVAAFTLWLAWQFVLAAKKAVKFRVAKAAKEAIVPTKAKKAIA